MDSCCIGGTICGGIVGAYIICCVSNASLQLCCCHPMRSRVRAEPPLPETIEDSISHQVVVKIVENPYGGDGRIALAYRL